MKQFIERFLSERILSDKVVMGAILMALPVVSVYSERWTGQVSALDGHRLVILKPAQFSSVGSSGKVSSMRHKSTVFGSAVFLDKPLQSEVSIRFPGKYQLWVRIGRPRKLPRSISASFSSAAGVLSRASLNGLDGSPTIGGKSVFDAYLDAAQKFSRAVDPRKSNDRIGEDLLTELADSKVQALSRWADLNRLEGLDANLPFYWWKLPPVELKPGEYALELTPDESDSKIKVVPVVDAAFLTANLDLPYPYLGEIDAKPASYARFRIDSLSPGKKDLRIGLQAQLHHGPWGAGANLAPNGINHSKPSSHSKTGYTRWYRLQDIENFSRFGGPSLSISLNIDPNAKGSTEFAIFPHEDFILHRFDWNEPDGKRLAMRTDFRALPWPVRTFRDYAREHYQMAVKATGHRLFPLSRAPLFFTNGWGNESGSGNDYLVKTLRLLGFNSCTAPDNVENSRRYGWRRAGGHYWPPVWMPYDEPASAKRYRSHYAREFAKRADSWGDLGTFQIADEPQEMKTNELSSPLWIYRAADDGSSRWFDPTNSSELLTRRKDLSDCVLEGVLHCGGIFELRVGRLSGEKPSFGFWSVGQRRNSPVNLVAGVHGGRQGGMKRPGATSNQNGLPFKIVYQAINKKAKDALTAGTAALYCNNKLMSQLNGLPSQGGFAILNGNEKSISKLRLRAIAKEERLAESTFDLDHAKDKAATDDLLADLKGVASVKPEFIDKDLRRFVEEDWIWGGGLPEAHLGFRKWLRERGVSLEEVGSDSWDKVRLMTIQSLADTPSRRRQYYWSRRYANYLTPRTFALAAEGIRAAVPEKDMKGFVALSGHALYLGKTAMPLDMFELAKYPELTPGVSDWMTSGSWRWDSHQAVAYSVAPFNAGARRYGEPPVNFPMMHCVYPSVFRSYTQLANQCKLISYWTFGPSYAATEGFWSDNFWSYHAVHKLNNRAAQLDDVLGEAVMRPSRVAMLYSHSTHLWSSADSYNDKRAAFLGLSHEYFQPELVTEEQVLDDCLRHYDALYVLEPHVSRAAQSKITKWTHGGGLLWTCSNSLVRDEYDEPCDWLAKEVGIRRIGESEVLSSTMNAAKDQPPFRPHSVVFGRRFKEVAFEDGVTRATYDDDSPAWIEKPFGRGRVVYLGHRAGITYSSQRISIGGRSVIWGDAGRDALVRPLKELGVSRELTLSESTVMASALSAKNGTVVVLYNMRPKPIEPLGIILKEDSAPKSVRVFEGDRLVDLPFDFANGKLKITLPRLNVNEGQMIVVRGNPARADPRSSVMEARAIKLLASDDPMDLSAGAWFAGFHPEWNLQESILSLVVHSRWEVRRSAVEALGRLRYGPAAPKLADMLEDDPDDHVRADALHALALVDPAVFLPIARRSAVDENLIVRLETMRAVDSLLSREDRGEGKDSEAPVDDGLSDIVATCLKDDAPAVRHLAIELYGRLQVKSLLAHALGTIPDSGDLERWAHAVASDADAFSQYLEQGMPGGENFFFALARIREAPAFVKELKRRFVSGERSEQLMNAVERQRDEGLMRLILDQRETLGQNWQSRLAHQLETTMNLGLGRDIGAWASELNSGAE